MESEITGGWKIIKGERRFIPLGLKWKKAHCVSCAYFSTLGECQLDGSFIRAYSEICENYIHKGKGKARVYF